MSMLPISALSYVCYMAKAIQREEAKRNRAAFLNKVEEAKQKTTLKKLQKANKI